MQTTGLEKTFFNIPLHYDQMRATLIREPWLKSQLNSGSSAIAAASESELVFTNTDVHIIALISRANQDIPNLENVYETEQYQLHFFILNHINFYLVSDLNEFKNTFLVLQNVEYLLNYLNNMHRFLALWLQICLAPVSEKCD